MQNSAKEINLQGQTALVTGGARGLGKCISQNLLKSGARVIVIDVLEELMEQFKQEDPRVICHRCDLTDWEGTRKLVESLGPIHLLVNNAGVSKVSPFVEISRKDIEYCFEVNYYAFVNVSQVVAKGMIERGQGGSILNISSMTTQIAFNNHTACTSSKGAVDSPTKIMALELGPHQIRVNAVHPHIVLTEMGKRGWADPVKHNKYLIRTPLGRLGEPQDMADGVVFLLSDMSKMINGQILNIDGVSRAVENNRSGAASAPMTRVSLLFYHALSSQ